MNVLVLLDKNTELGSYFPGSLRFPKDPPRRRPLPAMLVKYGNGTASKYAQNEVSSVEIYENECDGLKNSCSVEMLSILDQVY